MRATAFAMLLVLAVVLGTTPCGAAPKTRHYQRPGLDPKVDSAIEAFRDSVPKLMKKGGVPGYAVALVNERGILYTEGFGVTGGKSKGRVTPDTPFLICGMSKAITATAVMLAAQDGLVDLDEPITTYLPDFKVYSRFEENPERKITLRHLLSYTAGLAGEAPLGNYFEPASKASFEDHAKSVFGTWLRFPVGRGFFYSSASSDLAAYTIQVVSGRSFEQYIKDRLFAPLGMSNSTADREEILKTTGRAVGKMIGMSRVPAVYPALGAGGVYSSARDMGRFLQFQIGKGMVDGKPLLAASLAETMQRPAGIVRTDPNVYYGMGIFVDKRSPERTERVLHHDGWGFGFMSFMHWYPEYGIGAVALINKLPAPVFGDLALSLTDRLVKGGIVAKRFPQAEPDTSTCLGPFRGGPGHHVPTPYNRRWKPYCGTHNLVFNEYKLQWYAELAVLILGRDECTPRIRVHEKDGFLCLTESKFFTQVNGFRHVDVPLQEVKPGLFFTSGGDVIDFTRAAPTYVNYRLEER
ncbi:MAG: beta-lactamase family protein [Phycisphaerales bacterium]|nr:MAG: beta-lactamase family protein [Phycisphaerales bacterium]